MPLIKARTRRIKIVRHVCHLHEPQRHTLVLYARFIGDTVDYVVNQLIETTLAKDRDFLEWRAASENSPQVAPTSVPAKSGNGDHPERRS
jgi:hypothetical protein